MKPLAAEQQEALDLIMRSTGKLFFLTGQAGTGKSYTIDHIPGKVKRVAPTGIAAQLIGGTTIHRLLGIRPRATFASGEVFHKRLRGFKTLVVDEVSMVGFELFTLLMQAYHSSNWAGKIIFMGDFRQLPPVKDDFCFNHPEWANVQQVQLSTVHRQTDVGFLNVLNDIRKGDLSERVKSFISDRTTPTPKDRVKLASHRQTVGQINLDHLQDLLADGRDYQDYHADVKIYSQYLDEEKAKNEIMKNGRFPYMLRLCRGARVVLLTNSDSWYNGTTGVVLEVSNREIMVRGDDGLIHKVKRETEEIIDGSDRAIVSQHQFPISLAFALTIHKSQGMTLTKVHVDLNGHFAAGQTYVAISRAVSPEGISFSGELPSLSRLAEIPHD